MLHGRVGHYEVAERLGAGGAGEVYKARDSALDRFVAIKALLPGALADPRALARFRREALSAAALDHPYLCHVHELIEHEGMLLIVMEHVEGETLAARLARGPLPVTEALHVGAEIAEGLAAAHAHGLVHRDVKPSNVMVTTHHHVKLMDFGLAKACVQDVTGAVTRETATLPGEIVGTIRYMAPEQIEGATVDARTDVFAAGLVLYESLAGRLPFTGTSNAEYLSNVLAGRVVPLEQTAPHVPADVCRAVMRCLVRTREGRFASAEELAAELRYLAELHPMSSATHGGETARARGRLGVVLIGVVGLVAVTSGGLLSWRASRSPRTPEPAALEALATWPTTEREGRISPDGAWTSFISNADASWRVWLRRTDGGEPQAITLPPGDVVSHAWSPDGNEIAAVVLRDDRAWLHVAPAFFGGTPRVTVELPRASQSLRLAGWAGGSIFVEVSSPRSLWRVSLAEGAASELASFTRVRRLSPDDETMRDFAVDAAGTRVLYSSNRGGREDVWVADIDGTGRRRLTDDAFADRYPVWLGGAGDFVFQSNRGGQVDVWRGALAHERLTRVTVSGIIETPQGTSRDGSVLALDHEEERSNLWRLDLDSLRAAQITADALNDAWPTAAAGARLLVFQRLKSRSDSLYAFENTVLHAGTLGDEGLLDVRPVVDGYAAALAPDGHRLAYGRSDPSAPFRIELWVTDLRTHATRRLSQDYAFTGYYSYPFDRGGTSVAWQADGSALYFVANDGPERVLYRWRPAAWSSAPAAVARLTSPARVAPELAVDAAGAHVAVITTAEAPDGAVALVDAATGRLRALASVPGAGRLGLLGWDRAGDLLVLRIAERDKVPCTVTVVAVRTASASVRATLDNVFPASVQVAHGDHIYFTRAEGQAHGLFELALETGRLRRLTPPERAGITYSGVTAAGPGMLVFARQEVKEDVWAIRFER